MSIGPDIKDVLDELGTPFNIHHIDGSVSTPSAEKLDYDTYPDHSSEFIRQFFYTVALPYTTIVAKGDIISFNDTFFLVTNLTPSLFENGIVDYVAVLFRCNVFGGIIQRFSDSPGFSADYTRLPNWTDIYTGVYALHTEDRFGAGTEDFKDVLDFPIEKDTLYITGNYDIKIGDRWKVSSTEYYKIDKISTRRLDNVNIIALGSDTRPRT